MYMSIRMLCENSKAYSFTSKETSVALQSLKCVEQWSMKNPKIFSLYADQLCTAIKTSIQNAISTIKGKPSHSLHTQLLKSFNEIIFSSTFKCFWKSLATAANAPHSPIASHDVMNVTYLRILRAFIDETTDDSMMPVDMPEALTPDEQAAIHYIGGYIIKTIIKKISEKSVYLSNKEKLLYLVFHLLEDPDFSPHEDTVMDIFDILNWSKIIDRGGLHHCSSEFHTFLMAVEQIIKSQIKSFVTDSSGTTHQLPLSAITEAVQRSPLVIYNWKSAISTNSESSEYSDLKDVLFTMVLDEFCKIRGFAFTAHWMETYKYENRKKLTKSKSLRSKLQQNEQ